jgi:hypothetical protein
MGLVINNPFARKSVNRVRYKYGSGVNPFSTTSHSCKSKKLTAENLSFLKTIGFKVINNGVL